MDFENIRYYNPYQKLIRSRNRLPHWQQAGASYFVTFRLADSLPESVIEKWKVARMKWHLLHPKPWDAATEMGYHRLFCKSIDRHLDACYGSCRLADPRCSRILHDALLYFDGLRCDMLSFVIMPNHVHLLFQLNPDWRLEKLMHSWRRFSAREINKTTNSRGSLWQKDYFDRLIRDEVHFLNCNRYIERNPAKTSLAPGTYRLYQSRLLIGE